ncbi:hypothetical protein T06_2064 [Trichinella sp. T6]|nr:hypothetical protein T06_2064 [Trichinella sp. T6]
MKKKSENGVNAKRKAVGTMQNNKREKRSAMQITISIKVPYRQLGRTRSFDLRGKW